METQKIHRAKKSLGQNFLKSSSALHKIVEAGNITKEDTILEIGPGKGALTEKLLEKSNRVISVEKDRELFEFLKIKFSEQIKTNTLILVCGDILEFNTRTYNLETRTYKIIANIPYNITGAILKKFLTEDMQPECMVLMLQHEVATRILARDAKESILSISVKAYGTPSLVTKVDKRYFSPAPKVNSAVVKISNINRDIFEKNNIEESKFWKVVKSGFAHKRKKLSGNLKNIVKNSELFEKRAEDLTLLDWIELTKLYR